MICYTTIYYKCIFYVFGPGSAGREACRREQLRRKLLLEAQDSLHQVSVWTQELLTPASTPADAAQPGSNGAEVRASLVDVRDRAEKRRLAEVEAHDAEVKKLREGAKQLVDDVAKFQKAAATADGLAAHPGMSDVKRIREEALAVPLPAPPPARMVAPVSHTNALTGLLEPSGGLAQL